MIRKTSNLMILILFSLLLVPVTSADDTADDENKKSKDTPEDRYALTEDLTAGGTLRLRNEIRDGYFDNALPGSGDSYFLTQLRLNLDYQPSDWFRFFVEAQDARIFDGEAINTDTVPSLQEDTFDLHQSYFDINLETGDIPIRVRTGRQKMSLGANRIISSLPWSNTAVTGDGIRVTAGEKSERTLDTFVYNGVPPDNGSFNDWASSGNRLFDSEYAGTYYTDKNLLDDGQVEGYWLYRENGDLDDQVHMLGGRFENSWEPWDANAEVALQTGEYGNVDHRALAAHLEAGRTVASLNDTRFAGVYDYASGDDDTTDSTHNTFDNIYYIPLNHAYYGYMDFFSWQNLHHGALTAKTTVTEKLNVRLAYHSFWLVEEDTDSWYNGARSPVRNAGGTDVDSHVGSEIDLTVSYPFTILGRKTKALLGYSHFFPGSYVDDTGPSSGADFFYLQTKIQF